MDRAVPTAFVQHPEEQQIREDLAGLYRLLARYGMTDIVYTHISARLPGDEDLFLINRYGVLFENMRPEDLIVVDHEGRIARAVAPSDAPVDPGGIVNRAGFVIHSAIHMARPDIGCVIHTHTLAGAAISIRREGLLPVSQQALKFHGHLAYHDYEGIATDLAERERLIQDLGQNKAMILRNHGLLACGRTIAEAFNTIYMLETACRIQIAAQSGGGELIVPAPEILDHTADQYNRGGGNLAHYDFVWKALAPLR